MKEAKETVETAVGQYRNCVKVFEVYVGFVELAVREEEDAYIRAACLKELINGVKCLKEEISNHIYSSDSEKDAGDVANLDPHSSNLFQMFESKLILSSLCITFRRVIKTCIDQSFSLQLFNYCTSSIKLAVSLSSIVHSIDDLIHSLYLSSTMKLTNSNDDVKNLLDFLRIDVSDWIKPKTSSKKALEEQKEVLMEIVDRFKLNESKHSLAKLIMITYNDLQSLGGKPVPIPFYLTS